MKRTKIIFFDFDGTLSLGIENYCWTAIWKRINALDVNLKYYEMWRKKEITGKEWSECVLQEYKNRKVSKKLVEDVGDHITLLNDVFETFKQLTDDEIEIHILSGGIACVISRALKDAKKFVKNIEAHEFAYNENGMLCDIIYPETDINNKNLYVEKIIKQSGLSPNEMFFVGNDDNDEVIAKTGVPMLCINPDGAHYTDKNIWDYYKLNVTSLKEILEYIE